MAKKDNPENESRPQQLERSKFVETLAGYGMAPVEIGLLMVPALSEQEVKLQFASELELGPTKANLETVTMLRAAIKKGNVGAAIYWTKAKMGWLEKGPGPDKSNQDPGDRETPTGMPTPEQVLKDLGIPTLHSRSKRSRES